MILSANTSKESSEDIQISLVSFDLIYATFHPDEIVNETEYVESGQSADQPYKSTNQNISRIVYPKVYSGIRKKYSP